MTQTGFYTGRTFFAPAFRIKLDGQDAGREVIADVLEVSFTDDLENIDSFEFALNDWDPDRRQAKFSSPWDDKGQPLTLSKGGPPVPVFEPGAAVTLFMGYVEDCPASAPMRQKGRVEEGRISGPS